MRISVIIPVLNEEHSIGKVLDAIPAGLVREVIVCDNGSTDASAEVARQHGARVVHQPLRGYGNACLRAIEAADAPDVLVFLDGDYSDYPEELDQVAGPILRDEADLVIGSRVLGEAERGALLPQARFGNWLATRLLAWFFGVYFTDLGPFRAIRMSDYRRLGMCEGTFGWTVEMQVKAALLGLRCQEVPVRYRRRIGASKVSGTIKGSILAGIGILRTIFHYGVLRKRAPVSPRE